MKDYFKEIFKKKWKRPREIKPYGGMLDRDNSESIGIRIREEITNWNDFKNEGRTMKYKLKQWYPFLPDEWKGQKITVEKHDTGLNYYGNRENNPNKQIPIYQVEGNEEYWEPVEQVQVGQYWKELSTGKIFRIKDKEAMYGKDWRSIPINDQDITYVHWDESHLIEQCKKLSTDEIEQALIKEAKRRGFTIGTEYKYTNKDRTVSNGKFYYNESHDALYEKAPRGCVYEKGEFAQIVDQTPDIEINGYEPEYFDEYAKWGCAEIDKELFLVLDNLSKRYDGKKNLTSVTIGRGQFTMEEINQIAEYYKGKEDD